MASMGQVWHQDVQRLDQRPPAPGGLAPFDSERIRVANSQQAVARSSVRMELPTLKHLLSQHSRRSPLRRGDSSTGGIQTQVRDDETASKTKSTHLISTNKLAAPQHFLPYRILNRNYDWHSICFTACSSCETSFQQKTTQAETTT
jgi:hypothetical protein